MVWPLRDSSAMLRKETWPCTNSFYCLSVFPPIAPPTYISGSFILTGKNYTYVQPLSRRWTVGPPHSHHPAQSEYSYGGSSVWNATLTPLGSPVCPYLIRQFFFFLTLPPILLWVAKSWISLGPRMQTLSFLLANRFLPLFQSVSIREAGGRAKIAEGLLLGILQMAWAKWKASRQLVG